MFAVIYRWRLRQGREEQFVDGWNRVTRAIQRSCGSYGSRLHQASDGSWVAYARWPDEQTRKDCEHGETEGARLMGEAIAERLPEITMELVSDLLAEPRGAGPRLGPRLGSRAGRPGLSARQGGYLL